MKSSPLGLTVLALLHGGPLHPYRIQRLLKEYGKDQVVNVGQRSSLYRTIDRLLAGGLVTVKETERDQLYPERTVYEITDAGREATRRWLHEMLGVPRQEFPEFAVGLAHLLMLSPAEMTAVLEKRAVALAERLAALDASLGSDAARRLPRITVIEIEYLRTMAAAEAGWVASVLDDVRTGRLTAVTPADLAPFAAPPEG
ncbi:PadR family transcriptional regulator [Nonomuraea sp. NPDC004354]